MPCSGIAMACSGAGAHISGLGLGDRPHGVPSDEHRFDAASLHARRTPRTVEYTAMHAASWGALRRSSRAASHGRAGRRSAPRNGE
jgi:hypothetical protein